MNPAKGRWRQRLGAAVAVLTLLLAAGQCWLWYVSYQTTYAVGLEHSQWRSQDNWVGRWISIRHEEGHWLIMQGSNEFFLKHPKGISNSFNPDQFRRDRPGGFSTTYSRFNFQELIAAFRKLDPDATISPNRFNGTPLHYGFGHQSELKQTQARIDITRHIVFPGWITLLLLLSAPALWLLRWHRRVRRCRAGRCGECGYDLRATPDRCPECGTIPNKPAVST